MGMSYWIGEHFLKQGNGFLYGLEHQRAALLKYADQLTFSPI